MYTYVQMHIYLEASYFQNFHSHNMFMKQEKAKETQRGKTQRGHLFRASCWNSMEQMDVENPKPERFQTILVTIEFPNCKGK